MSTIYDPNWSFLNQEPPVSSTTPSKKNLRIQMMFLNFDARILKLMIYHHWVNHIRSQLTFLNQEPPVSSKTPSKNTLRTKMMFLNFGARNIKPSIFHPLVTKI